MPDTDGDPDVQYQLTTDTIAPADFESYVAQQRGALPGLPAHCCAAWLPKFGTPNQMTLVQQVGREGELPEPPTTPLGTRLHARVRELVDVIRPFPASLGDRSLCELRTYRIAPEHWDGFIALKTGILPLRESYSPSFGVFVPATGVACRIMHLWGYASLEERDAVRGRLKSDAGWGAYISQILPMIAEMQSILIMPILPA